jgi:hypothetical protein
MPFGFGKKDDAAFNTTLNAKDDLEEIKKIAEHLDTDETVLVVAKQSRIKLGGSLATPNVIFATDRRLIVKHHPACARFSTMSEKKAQLDRLWRGQRRRRDRRNPQGQGRQDT